MDNLFGKEDSGNESDAIDITDKTEKFENEIHESIEIEEHAIKEELNTSGSFGADAGSDVEHTDLNKLDASNPSGKSMETSISKSTISPMDINREDDLFSTNIVLPRTVPIPIKERRESKEKNRKELEEEEREKMQVLVSNFTEDQLDRYEMYRRAAFPKAAIKRIMQTITGCSVSQNVVIAMSGIAKVFVGEIVEQALDVAETHGESAGPLQPKHLRESVRTLRLQGQIPTGRTRKAFLRL